MKINQAEKELKIGLYQFVLIDKIFRNSKILLLADLAQLVEQRTRNA